MIINIIGCDGCGKSTQVELLREYIKKEYDLNALTFSKRSAIEKNNLYPGFQYFGVSYRELMWELLPKMTGPGRSLFLFNLFALQLSEYDPSRLYVMDGGWSKHVATEQIFGIDKTWLKSLAKCFPKIDMTIFIDTPPDTILHRRHLENYRHAPYECGPTGVVTDSNFYQNMCSLREILCNMAGEESWTAIEGEGCSQDIHQAIIGQVKHLIEANI